MDTESRGLDKCVRALEAVATVLALPSMKKLLPVVIVVAGAGAVFVALNARKPTYTRPQAEAQATIPMALASQPALDERVRVFDVDGMCCGGCRPKVYEALVKLSGVREAAVEVGRAFAIVKEDVDVASIEKALTFDDYVAHARP